MLCCRRLAAQELKKARYVFLLAVPHTPLFLCLWCNCWRESVTCTLYIVSSVADRDPHPRGSAWFWSRESASSYEICITTTIINIMC
jgi:hypothetical protein